MKREILFRGKRVKDGKLVEGDLLQICGGTVIYHGSKTKSGIKENSGACIELFESEVSVVIHETVGQFTGLLDKNGEKIFEGDIVKYYQPFANRTDIHIVLYDDLFASFCLFEKDNKWAKESDWMKIQDVEVIGNIYDNSKLLNK